MKQVVKQNQTSTPTRNKGKPSHESRSELRCINNKLDIFEICLYCGANYHTGNGTSA